VSFLLFLQLKRIQPELEHFNWQVLVLHIVKVKQRQNQLAQDYVLSRRVVEEVSKLVKDQAI